MLRRGDGDGREERGIGTASKFGVTHAEGMEGGGYWMGFGTTFLKGWGQDVCVWVWVCVMGRVGRGGQMTKGKNRGSGRGQESKKSGR